MSAWSKAALVQAYVICDECSTGSDACQTRTAAIRYAKADGWRIIKGRVVCPTCQAETEPRKVSP